MRWLNLLKHKVSVHLGRFYEEEPMVPSQVLMKAVSEESQIIKEKREASIAFLRSFSPSKYVLDQKIVPRPSHNVLGNRRERIGKNH